MLALLIILGVGLLLAILSTWYFTKTAAGLFKKVDGSKMSENFHNYAANNTGTMSSMGPWGTAISGISKVRGYGN